MNNPGEHVATHWYQQAVVYQLHVRAFLDSNGDGIGDFRGLTQKLNYLRDLGVTVIWLLPFYPSPLKDDGYDIADYRGVHPHYGTLSDFQIFLREAHQHGLRVITEMVLNHCSDQSAWFQRARQADRDNPVRDFFVWSDTPEKYSDARIIFHDFETSNWSWDTVAGAYYWHRFYHHQPDLNFDNPTVRREMTAALDYWLQMGVDGVRLDAVPYLFEREGTTCENLPETHAFLKDLRRHLDENYTDRMFLAEANQWPEDAVEYFGDGDECHTAFHFPVMPRLFMAVQMEDRFPLIDILEQTPPIPDNCQWFVFLRNHDELTLEMVTAEERDYMYRMYARQPQARLNQGIRRRLAPLLQNDRRKIELLNGLLMSLPGTPVIYYGDEIGMGDNIYLGDRDGVRTPMQWSADRNAGFSRANAQRLFLPVVVDHEYHYEAINVETQQHNPHSLLWWMKRIIALRQRYSHVFGTGIIEFLYPENSKVLAFLRRQNEDCILVVANLSRFAQFVQLDLSEFSGATPRELVGRTPFPRIGELPYLLTLGPHAILWFAIEASQSTTVTGETVAIESSREKNVAKIILNGDWETIFDAPYARALNGVLAQFLRHQPWYQGTAKTIEGVRVIDRFPIKNDPREANAWLSIVHVDYLDGEHELYQLLLSFAPRNELPWIGSDCDPMIVAELETNEGSGVLYDACGTDSFSRELFHMIHRQGLVQGIRGALTGQRSDAFAELWPDQNSPQRVSVPLAGQSMASVNFDDTLLLKHFRRVDEGISPELELRRWLKEAGFTHCPDLAGELQAYEPSSSMMDEATEGLLQKQLVESSERPEFEPWTIGILQKYVRNQGTAWDYAVQMYDQYLEELLTEDRPHPADGGFKTEAAAQTLTSAPPPPTTVIPQPVLDMMRQLGRQTAELHEALASAPAKHQLAPEPLTSFYRRSIYQRMRTTTVRTFRTTRSMVDQLSEQLHAVVLQTLDQEKRILEQMYKLLDRRIQSKCIRCHGSLHLGNLLFSGNDFLFINFEGPPGKSLSERRLKSSPLSDVAELLHSLTEASHTAMKKQLESGLASPEQHHFQHSAVLHGPAVVNSACLTGYIDAATGKGFIPNNQQDTLLLLNLFRLERAILQIGHDIHHDPLRLMTSCPALLQLLETA